MLAACFAASGLFAQNINRCGTTEYNALQEANDPGLAAQRKLINDQVQYIMQQPGNQKGAIVTIPVVFLVVYKQAAENVPDAQIFAQLDQLNLDYLCGNPDTATVPSAFKPVLGKPQVQFCLAKQDPNGQATTGIVRRQTNTSTFSTNNAVKYFTSGGLDAWDRTKYLNLWVCNLGSGLLGYAQFPGGSAATDGVVVHYGTVGSALKPSSFNWGPGANFNWGRSATHEIGHWLGLYHTFDGGCPNTSCTTQGDQVCDTPPVSGPSYGCPAFPKISCSNGPNGGMFMNFMDYVDDDCMKMFSTGQSTRMNGFLNAARASLKTSPGCIPVGIEEIMSAWDVSVFPNPAGDYVDISLSGLTGHVDLSFIDAGGRVAIGETLAVHAGTIRERIDVSDLARGLYVIQIRGTEGTVRKRVALAR